jgi:selenocysteine lyase/cysteine desulfurase
MLLLKNGTFGNPHSSNPTSLASMQLDEHARKYVLEYFNASSKEYVVNFTQNASGALKPVGESYPFGADFKFPGFFQHVIKLLYFIDVHVPGLFCHAGIIVNFIKR